VFKKNINVVVNSNCFESGSRGVKEYYTWLCDEDGDSSEGVIRFRELKKTRWGQLLWWFKNNSNVIWSPSHATSIISRRHVVTVHDLINLDNCRLGRAWFRFLAIYINLFFVFLFSPAIVCISKATEARVHFYFPFVKCKTFVFTSPARIPVGEDTSTLSIINKEQFVLVVSNNLPHKNNEFVLENLPKYLSDLGLQLVIVGVENDCFKKEISNVLHYQKLSDPEMNFLFRNCLCVCSPSLAEGHNIVLAKANSLNKPLLASDIAVHREYYPNAFFFNPSDPATLIDAMSVVNLLPEAVVTLNKSCCKSIEQLKMDYFCLFKKVGERFKKNERM
jgi:glycosyltransferase involved in cell wall biosynthesis